MDVTADNRLFVIINPVSGTRKKKDMDRVLVDELCKRGFEVDSAFTAGPGHATELAREAAGRGYCGVVACGGDGTVNETARGLTGTDTALGIVPCGSGNGLARHIDIPMDTVRSLDIIAARDIRRCDCGAANGHPFFCTFGLGFDAAVSDRFAGSGSRGLLTYVRSALHEFVNYKTLDYTVEADGETFDEKALIVAVCNANQYGNNAYIAPDASITDGLLDLVIVRDMPRLAMMPMTLEMMAGMLKDGNRVIKRKVSKVVITRENGGPAQLDGERFDDAGRRVEIECRPGVLNVFANPGKPDFRPLITPVRSLITGIDNSVKNLFHIK